MCAHFKQMKSYIDRLENLNVIFDNSLAVDLVLGSLPSSYSNFIISYHLNIMENTLMELYNLLQNSKFEVMKVHATPQS